MHVYGGNSSQAEPSSNPTVVVGLLVPIDFCICTITCIQSIGKVQICMCMSIGLAHANVYLSNPVTLQPVPVYVLITSLPNLPIPFGSWCKGTFVAMLGRDM